MILYCLGKQALRLARLEIGRRLSFDELIPEKLEHEFAEAPKSSHVRQDFGLRVNSLEVPEETVLKFL
jgi:hypothetical protein